ncbi:glycosyltransferase [Taibaiella soli]|uniref:Glycosyltransferase 2-like domain-containing protein n=1 Tax=Taibaiella soli TaxID=1649169 RepID=A0A2W2B7U8_9BACT|nr:glycosyltransferase [Taibaiella soli]PZF72037.1 hypothetical protein DN068_15490 [Taibaiella soli]
MNNKPDVSLVIINYNKPEYTKSCIHSIIKHTALVSYEIIVVDNASTQGDISDIESIDSRIKLVRSSENLGFAKGNNLGIEHTSGEVVLLLNNDTLLLNDAVGLAYRFLTSKSNAGVVSARLQYPDGNIQHCAQPLPEIKYLLIQLFRLQKLMPKARREEILLSTFFDHNRDVKAGWVWGTFFMFKKSMLPFLPAGKLADDFFMYNEDLQWGIETARAGYETWFCAEAKVVHFEGQNTFKNEMASQNFEILMNRYYGSLYYRVYKAIEKLAHSLS